MNIHRKNPSPDRLSRLSPIETSFLQFRSDIERMLSLLVVDSTVTLDALRLAGRDVRRMQIIERVMDNQKIIFSILGQLQKAITLMNKRAQGAPMENTGQARDMFGVVCIYVEKIKKLFEVLLHAVPENALSLPLVSKRGIKSESDKASMINRYAELFSIIIKSFDKLLELIHKEPALSTSELESAQQHKLNRFVDSELSSVPPGMELVGLLSRCSEKNCANAVQYVHWSTRGQITKTGSMVAVRSSCEIHKGSVTTKMIGVNSRMSATTCSLDSLSVFDIARIANFLRK